MFWRVSIPFALLSYTIGIFFLYPQISLAVLYAPGETLDPACAPTDLECGIIAPSIASSTAGSIPYYAVSGSTLASTSALTILSNGNIGIGTTTPLARLNIDSGGSNIVPLSITTNGSAGNYTATNSAMFIRDASGQEMLRIFASDPDYNSNYNSGNLFIGRMAGANHPTNNTSAGYWNTAVGTEALYSNTTGYANDSYGLVSLYSNTTGFYNSAFGYTSLGSNTTGSNNAAFGTYVLNSNTTGSNNAAVGTYSLYSNVGGTSSVAFGRSSLYYNTDGRNNTGLGMSTGFNPLNDIGQYRVTTDSDMVLLGYGATKNNASTLTNGIAIGSGAHVLESNQVVLGNDSITSTLLKGNVGLGILDPNYKLDVSGTVSSLSGNSSNPAVLAQNNAGGYSLVTYTNNDSGVHRNYLTSAALTATGSSTSSMVEVAGVLSDVGKSGSGSLSRLIAFHADGNWSSGGTVGINAGFFSVSQAGVGTLNAAYYAADQGSGSGDYAFYAVGGKSYFGGFVGIGTTTPAYTLHVGNTVVSGVVSRFENSTGYCDINPTTTALVCTSDERLKKNILTIESESTLEKVLALEAVTYNWLQEEDDVSPHAGFIAQDVREIFPDLVSEDPNGTLSVSYTGFIPYMIESIKEIASVIEGLGVSFTSERVTTDTLCVKKSDGEDVCVTGDELDEILGSATSNDDNESNEPVTEEPVEEVVPPEEEEVIEEVVADPVIEAEEVEPSETEISNEE